MGRDYRESSAWLTRGFIMDQAAGASPGVKYRCILSVVLLGATWYLSQYIHGTPLQRSVHSDSVSCSLVLLGSHDIKSQYCCFSYKSFSFSKLYFLYFILHESYTFLFWKTLFALHLKDRNKGDRDFPLASSAPETRNVRLSWAQGPETWYGSHTWVAGAAAAFGFNWGIPRECWGPGWWCKDCT